ncbi:MAG: hypothetical protein WCO51_04800 [bacterium]
MKQPSLYDFNVEVISFPSGAGGSVALLPSYGRVIGVWTGDEADNAFWTNSEFNQGASLWDNPGGDRLWLAPEFDFFIPDPNDPWGTYTVPVCFDPGKYSFTAETDSITLQNSGAVTVLASGVAIPFKTKREIRAFTSEGLRRFTTKPEIATAGYEETTTLEVEGDCPMELGFWDLIQVPQGGTVMVGKKSGSDYVTYPGDPTGAIGENEHGYVPVSYAMKNRFKVGFQGNDLTGVIGYYRELGVDSASLIIRGFELKPDGRYIDPPFGESVEFACPVQLFYGADVYPFGEVEYHSPAVGKGVEKVTCKSYLCALTGPRDTIQEVISEHIEVKK